MDILIVETSPEQLKNIKQPIASQLVSCQHFFGASYMSEPFILLQSSSQDNALTQCELSGENVLTQCRLCRTMFLHSVNSATFVLLSNLSSVDAGSIYVTNLPVELAQLLQIV